MDETYGLGRDQRVGKTVVDAMRRTDRAPWQSSDVRPIGDDRMAVVTSIRNARGQWTGQGQPPDWTHVDGRDKPGHDGGAPPEMG